MVYSKETAKVVQKSNENVPKGKHQIVGSVFFCTFCSRIDIGRRSDKRYCWCVIYKQIGGVYLNLFFFSFCTTYSLQKSYIFLNI